MKKHFISMLALVALAACSKGEEPAITPDKDLVPIIPTAGIQMIMETKAPIAGATFGDGTGIFNVVAYSGATAPTTDWSTPFINNEAMNKVGGVLEFANSQYYPINGDNVYFYAWTPVGTPVAGTSSVAPKTTYTIDGTQDIMGAQVTTGFNKTSGQPEFTFAHKLMQVSFSALSDGTFPAGAKVKKITIKEIGTAATMDISTGVLDVTGTADLSVYTDATGIEIPTGTAATIGSAVMIKPGATFKISVETTEGTLDASVTLTGTNAGEAGMSHVVTLNFKGVTVVPSDKITGWIPGDGGSVDLK